MPEDWNCPSGRRLRLRVAVIASESGIRPEALFFLAGGPAGGDRAVSRRRLGAGRRAARPRRGPRRSARHGRVRAARLPRSRARRQRGRARRRGTAPRRLCPPARRLGDGPRPLRHERLRAPSEAVRAALGHSRVDLVAVSDGTRAALAWLRAHPERSARSSSTAWCHPGWRWASAPVTRGARANSTSAAAARTPPAGPASPASRRARPTSSAASVAPRRASPYPTRSSARRGRWSWGRRSYGASRHSSPTRPRRRPSGPCSSSAQRRRPGAARRPGAPPRRRHRSRALAPPAVRGALRRGRRLLSAPGRRRRRGRGGARSAPVGLRRLPGCPRAPSSARACGPASRRCSSPARPIR